MSRAFVIKRDGKYYAEYLCEDCDQSSYWNYNIINAKFYAEEERSRYCLPKGSYWKEVEIREVKEDG